jgi:hypothetical protein
MIVFAMTAFGLAITSRAQEPLPPPKEQKAEFAELSRMIHKMIVKEVPREHEEKIDWHKSTPIPPKLLFPNLPRTFVVVGDKKELAHGAWKRVKVKVLDPEKDVRVKVKEWERMDKGGYRAVIDAEVSMKCDGELQEWLNGLSLVKLDGQADTTVASSMVCHIDIKVNVKKFPPEVTVNPKIVEMTVDLKEFNLTKAAATVKGVRLEGDALRNLGNEQLPDLIRSAIKEAEPTIKEYANKAIADGLKESKGKLAPELLKGVPKEKEKK